MFNDYDFEEDSYFYQPEHILTVWRDWYDERQEHLLPPQHHKYFIKIYEVMKIITVYDRQVLTGKYFNLKEIETSSFKVRSQKDSELAKKFKVGVKTMRDQRVNAMKQFTKIWEQIEVDRQVFVVGRLAIKAKILSPTKYELVYLKFETDEVVKTEVIDLDSYQAKKGESQCNQSN